jgi:hypothetical protein
MATTMSFKQQCPSCEAMVPIKDKSLVGRKIDCPKCKYRFVVESPGEDEDAEEEKSAPAAKKNGKATAIKKGPPPAKVKGKPTGKKTKPDDDDAGETKPKKKLSPTLLIGIGLAGVALIGLVIGGLALAFGGGDTPAAPPGKPPGGGGFAGGGNAGGGTPGDADKPGGAGGDTKPADVSKASQAADVSNLLPNDTQAVVNLNIDKILGSSVNLAALGTPGAFNPTSFAQTFSFPLDALARVVLALNMDKRTVFSVLRTAKPYDRDRVMASLQLEPQTAVKGLNYFKVKRSLDSLGTFLVRANQPVDQLMVYLPDSQTLIFADAPLMQDYLDKGAKPEYLTKSGDAPATPGRGSPGGPGSEDNPGAGRGPGKKPGAAGSGGPGDAAAGPGGRGPGTPAAGAPGAGGLPNAPGAAGFPGGPGAGPSGGAPDGGASPPAVPSGSYLTVDPALKNILDQLEKEEKSVLMTVVANKQSRLPDRLVNRLVERASFGPLTQVVMVAAGPLADQFKEMDLVGASVLALDKDKLSAHVIMEGRSVSAAKKLTTTLVDLAGKLVAVAGKEILQLELALANQDDSGSGSTPGGAGFGPGATGPGAGGDAASGGSGDKRFGGGRSGPGGPGPGRGSFGPPGRGSFGPPGAPPGGPGVGGPGGDLSKPDQTKGDGTVDLTLRDKTLDIVIDINLKDFAHGKILTALKEQMIQLKGESAVSDNRSHMHELAAALKRYVEDKKQFPRGTVPRPLGGRPIDFAPTQRMSWMVELLPYLGEGEYKELLADVTLSWNEGVNLQLAQVVIPQFMGDLRRVSAPQIRYPGVVETLAPTHWVAISGRGMDAAEYNPQDPAVGKKLGIFGYDRITKLADIKDGPENTIALLMVPLTSKTPWLAGGGSTVRGVSDDEKDGDVVLPFVCGQYEGQEGTFAIMADFKVRFIPKDIRPAMFRAMCTIAGGERLDDLDKIAPEVPAPSEVVAPKKDAAAPINGKPDAPATEAKPTPPVEAKPTPPDAPKSPDSPPLPGGGAAAGGANKPQ